MLRGGDVPQRSGGDQNLGGRTPGVLCETAERYSEEFAEIIVDEYQDISFLQDDILRAISNGHNLFMVGDIKQAIYRFREANPEVFNEKYKKYRHHNFVGFFNSSSDTEH